MEVINDGILPIYRLNFSKFHYVKISLQVFIAADIVCFVAIVLWQF